MKKFRIVLTLTLTIFFLLISLAGSLVSAQTFDWTTFQKNETRNGYTNDQLFLPLTKLTEIDINDPISGTVLVSESNIYFTTKNGYIGCVSLFDNEIIWIRSVGEEILSSLTLSDNNIFVATNKGSIFCLAQQTGTIIWQSSLDSPVVAPLTIYFRFLYAPGINGKVYCLNVLDGNIVWATDLQSKIETAACLKLNHIFITTVEGKIYSLDCQNGKVIWFFNLENQCHISPMAGVEFVLIGDDGGKVYCFDDITGRLIWEQKASSPLTTAFAFAYFDNRIICAGAKDSYVGIVTGTGVETWKHPVKNASIPPVSAGRIVVFSDGEGNLLAADAFNGEISFKEDIGDNISTSLSISNGKIIFGTESGKIMIYGSAVYDFSIKVEPEISAISPGESTKYSILVNATEGFKDPISFSVSGFPCSCKGVARYFDKSVLVPPDNKINLVIDTSPEADPIKVKFTVAAISGRDLRREASGVVVIQNKSAITSVSISYPMPIKAGEDFKTSIYIKDANNLRSANFLINYPSEILFLRDVTIGNFFTTGQENLSLDKTIDNEKGKVIIGVTRKTLGESGTGEILDFVFRAKKPGNAKLEFSKISLRDSFFGECSYEYKNAEFAISSGKQLRMELTIGKLEIKINDRIEKLESPPIIENSRTLVPIRIIAENCEAKVLWDNKLRKVTLERFDKVIELFIDNPTCKVNGKEKSLPSGVAPKIIQGRTFLPLRFVAEELDAKVDWISLTQTIIILYPGY